MSLARVLCQELGTPRKLDAESIVFVVNDDISARESLESLISCKGWKPETFSSGHEFLSRRRSMVPSCMVLDISSPGRDGLELQKRVAAERPNVPIIFVTGYEDVPTTVQAMKAGAVDFLTKPLDEDVLLSAIRTALERSRVALSREAHMRSLQERYVSLSRRERQVMVLVISGLLNKEIGAELGISEITVKAHRGRVMQKMKAGSLADLVRMAAKLRLAPAGMIAA